MSTISTNAIQSVGTTLQIGTQNNTKMQIDSDGNVSSVIPGGSTLLPEFKCRAWASWSGADGTLRGSGNVSSVTRVSTGQYRVNFETAMPSVNYSAVATATQTDSTVRITSVGYEPTFTQTTTQVQFKTAINGLNTTDAAIVSVCVFH